MQTCVERATITDTKQPSSGILWLIAVLMLLGGSGCTKAPPTSGHMTHLRGQLVDSGGRPVSQYPMKLDGASGSSVSSAITDFSGYFEFADVPPGTYTLYPANRPGNLAKTVRVDSGRVQFIGQVSYGGTVGVELNPAAAPVINEQARRTINPEAARTINPDAARTINSDAAKMINPAAARVINPEAAGAINPEAARVLNPERAKILSKEQARILTVEQAKQAPAH